MTRLLNTTILLLFIVGFVRAEIKHQNSRKNVEPQDSETPDQCPELTGYFPDAEQCDKYYECTEGAITEKLCPDGKVFSIEFEKCVLELTYNINCSSRPKLQAPQPSLHCPRKNGYFRHEELHICDKFYYCYDGQFNMITCPNGLVYNDKTGTCSWPDEAKRKNCSSEEAFQFVCPTVNESVAATHPRYSDPDDCQYFYVCVNGDIPRRNGCKLGQVFDDVQKKCDWPRTVPECVDWYKGRLTDEELRNLENPPTPKPKPTKVRIRRPTPPRPISSPAPKPNVNDLLIGV